MSNGIWAIMLLLAAAVNLVFVSSDYGIINALVSCVAAFVAGMFTSIWYIERP